MKKQKRYLYFFVLFFVMVTISLLVIIHYRTRNFDNLLFTAVERGDISGINKSISQGANINAFFTYKNRTSILRTVKRWLFNEYSCGNGMKFGESDTPLMGAVRSQQYEIIQCLLQNGADVNRVNSRKQTPLLIAAYYEDQEIVRLLLDAGADIHIKDEDGNTVLAIARQKPNQAILHLIERRKSLHHEL